MKKYSFLFGFMLVAALTVQAQTPIYNTLGIGIATPQGTLHIHTTDGYYYDQPIAEPSIRDWNYPYDYYQTLFRTTNTTTGTNPTDGFVINQTNQTITFQQYEDAPIHFKSYTGNGFTLLQNGYLGIGTDQPENQLHVDGDATVSHALTVKKLYVTQDVNTPLYVKMQASFCTDSNPLSIGRAHSEDLGWGSTYVGFNAERNADNGRWSRRGGTLLNGGAVIWATMEGDLLFANLASTGGSAVTGITDGEVMSSVNLRLGADGVLMAKEVRVTLDGWPDYVFGEGFQLMPLSETESYIKTNGHLPGVPSAEEVEEEGLSLGEMNRLLMQKVEELTLHLIELQKQVDELKNR